MVEFIHLSRRCDPRIDHRLMEDGFCGGSRARVLPPPATST